MAGELRMPKHLLERAKQLAQDKKDGRVPPALRAAATVVMVSDSPDGLRVYLQRRVPTMAFAAGMYVFPGGAVEPADEQASAELFQTAPPDSIHSDSLRVGSDALGYDTLAARFAAVRETAEETSYDIGDPLELKYVGHWATPEVEDRRYDTRFYAVAVTTESQVVENSGESDADRWVTPLQALKESRSGEMKMLPPTVATLAAFADMAKQGFGAQEAIEQIGARPVIPLMPAAVAAPEEPGGIAWALLDVRTNTEVARLASPPAGSEVEGSRSGEADSASGADPEAAQ